MSTTLRLFLAPILLLALGCSQSDKPDPISPEGPGSAPVGETRSDGSDAGAEQPSEAPEADTSDCMQSCQQANMARAVSAEQITRDCARECEGEAGATL